MKWLVFFSRNFRNRTVAAMKGFRVEMAREQGNDENCTHVPSGQGGLLLFASFYEYVRIFADRIEKYLTAEIIIRSREAHTYGIYE